MGNRQKRTRNGTRDNANKPIVLLQDEVGPAIASPADRDALYAMVDRLADRARRSEARRRNVDRNYVKNNGS